MDAGVLFVSGLIVTAVVGSAALKSAIPDPPTESKKIGLLREIVHKTEVIREPMATSRGRTVMCPYCNKIIQ